MRAGRLQSLVVALALAGGTFAGAAGETPGQRPALDFGGTAYLHRWSAEGQEQHEYTPAGQEDLKAWREMITVIYFPQFTDGEGLAQAANRSVAYYQSIKGQILHTRSVPATETAPAEHLLIAVLPGENVVEAVFARHKLVAGVATVTLVAHREYGPERVAAMQTWLGEYAHLTDTALMAWAGIPAYVPPAAATK